MTDPVFDDRAEFDPTASTAMILFDLLADPWVAITLIVALAILAQVFGAISW
jgi:hypothetical protein